MVENNNNSESLIIKLIQDRYDLLITQIQEDLKGSKVEIQKVKDHLELAKTDITNKLQTYALTQEKRIDFLDDALRGSDDRVGMFEIIRKHQVYFRVIFICLTLLLGIKLWGFGIEDVVMSLFSDSKPAATQPDSSPPIEITP